MTGAVIGVKDHIMGSAADAKSSTGDVMSNLGDNISATPGKVARQTQGSPLAAGLIAFGTGLLLSALIPASRPEAHAAAAIKDQAQPLVDQLTEAGKDAASNLQEPAQQALESVTSTASDAVDTVKDEGSTAVSDVKDQAQDAKTTVTHHTSGS
jgi:hypothetical protein